jgi:RNA polymerase sigma factor (sigma-70 family)
MRTREQIADELLVLAAQAGRVEAFERLAERWHPRLLHHAQRLTGDPEGAREAAQEAWVAVARGLHRLRDPECFGAWALCITSRRCMDWIADRQVLRRRAASLAGAAGVAADPRPDDHLVAMREALRGLQPEPRALLAMFYVEGLSVLEIAHALAVPAGAVKSRLYHARAGLRATLEV